MRKFLFISIFCILSLYASAQTASFTWSYTTGTPCLPTSVMFTNTSTNPSGITAINWNFGDGTPAYTIVGTDPTHPYTTAGNFTVVLTVTYGSTTKTYSETIRIVEPLTATFTKANDTICPGETVSFTMVPTAPATTSSFSDFLWNFGDGGNSRVANPTWRYLNAGNTRINYTVGLTVTDINGCVSTYSEPDFVFVKNRPEVNFTVDDSVFCYNASQTTGTSTFTNLTSVTSNNTYRWFFGAMSNPLNTSTQENPTQVFPQGNYDVSLVATSTEGCSDTLTKTNYIRMVNFSVKRTVSDTILCEVNNDNSVVTFRGINGGGTTYHWLFGDGHEGHSSAGPITNRYRQAGDFTVIVTGTHLTGCTAKDTFMIHVTDDKRPSAATIIDTNMCDPATPVIFKNSTQYPTTNDFGMKNTLWLFGDGQSATGDSVAHAYGSFGDYTITMVHTTPYGCTLDSTYYNVHIFAMKAAAAVTDPAPPDPPHGCAPHTVTLANIPDSLKSSSPITDFIWRWNYGVDNSDSTNSGSTSQIQHTYNDTGVFAVYITLINQQGCRYDVPVATIMVGYPPLSGFEYDFIQGCKSAVGLQVRAYDSLDANGKLIAKVPANNWQWLDDQGNPLATGDTTSVSFSSVGYQPITLAPSHNGCVGTGPRYDSVCYVCPPIAAFDNPKNDMAGNPPLFCEYPYIEFAKNQDNVMGTKYMWWFGDGSRGTMFEQHTDTLTKDSNDPVFQYPYGLLDSATHPEPNYLYTLKGVVMATLWAMNDDSLDPNSPTYNRCGYCEDMTTQQINISEAKMNFSTNLGKENIYVCEGDSIQFWDSTVSTQNISMWGFGFTNAGDTDPSHLVQPYNQYLSLNPYYRPAYSIQQPRGGYWVTFPKPNTYTVLMRDTCDLGCIRYDSVHIRIYPRSVPQFVTSHDNVHFIGRDQNHDNYSIRDTLCATTPDTLYVRDQSFSPSPFDTVSIIAWKWKLNNNIDTSSLQNPMLLDTFYGLHTLELTVTNEYGCDSTVAEEERVLTNVVQANYATQGQRKRYCNREIVTFQNKSNVLPLAFNTNTIMQCTWDWGDGTPTETQYITNSSRGSDLYKQHVYDLPNLSTKVPVTLTVEIQGSTCKGVFVDTIEVNRPIASFDDNGHVYPCIGIGQNVSFWSTSQGNIVNYEWIFGDSASGSADTALGPNMDSVVHFLVAIDGPAGTFTYSPFSGCINLRAEFTPTVKNVDTVIISPDGGSQMTFTGMAINNTQRYTYRTPGTYVPYFYLIKWTNKGDGTKERCVVQWNGNDTIWAIEMIPDFDTTSVYCSGVPITFANTTQINPNLLSLDSAKWVFFSGDDTTTMIDGQKQYDSAGIYRVSMTGYSKMCSKSKNYYIEVIDIPDLTFVPDSAGACDGLEVEIKMNDSTYTDVQYARMVDWQWTFNDGEQFSGHPIRREFTQTGDYAFEVELTYTPKNCVRKYTDTISVAAYKSPVAAFTPNPTEANAGETFSFTDASTPGDGRLVKWTWEFGDGVQDSTTGSNVNHVYKNTSGYITVTMVVTDEYGCKSNAEEQVLVTESMAFPNAFTPNGTCEVSPCRFCPIEDKGFFKELKMEVYNKWGALVWKNSCKDPDCPSVSGEFWWDGRNKQGNVVSDGVYYWVLYGVPLSETNTIILNGSVTIMSN